MFKKNKIVFFFVLFVGLFLRLYGNNWDQGLHLHPDERMLIMVADRINFFKNLNPHFFNYGSLPIYILKGLSQLIDFLFYENVANYTNMLTVGRNLSVFFDLVTLCFIYKIGQLLFKKSSISLLSSLVYAVVFFSIQNAHFFVVDVLLTALVTGLIYTLLIYLKSPSIKKVIFLGLIFAAMMATKFTAILFLPLLLLVLFFKNRKSWKNIFIHMVIFNLSFLIFHFVFMPYAFIENRQFITDIKEQLKMNSNPYIFPYTLQYVGTLPYLYYLKNIFFWGLGPIISILSIVGLYQIVKIKYQKYRLNFKKRKFFIFDMYFLFLIFYFLYFLIVGRSAVKFMRYMLPLYPFFALLAGYGLYKLYKVFKPLSYILIIGILLWSFMFINIYSQKHTRIVATEWILKNIPKGATIATEHWDDSLPLYKGENYTNEQLTLYDQPDDENKWKMINAKLKQSDYIIIASNRLYIPLQKLSDCTKYVLCYPKTAKYYQNLFSNKLSFIKIAEFSSYPYFQLGNWKIEIKDDYADESFTVYDHPKIFIFKKNEKIQ